MKLLLDVKLIRPSTTFYRQIAYLDRVYLSKKCNFAHEEKEREKRWEF